MVDLAPLNVRITADTTDFQDGMTEANTGLTTLGANAERVGRNTQRTGGNITALGGAARGTSPQLRMMSMQLSQVAQQGAATGNYMQALAIQAPDLALGFGAIGIAVGALIPILYGVGSAFLEASDSGATFEDTVEGMTAAVSAYRDVSSALSGTMDDLSKRFGVNIEEGQRLLEIQQQLARVQAQAAVSRGLSRVGEEIGAGPFSLIDPRLITAGSEALEDYENRLYALIEAEQAASDADLQFNAARQAAIQVYQEQLYQVSQLDKSFGELAETLGVETGPAVQAVARAMAELAQAETLEDQVAASQRLADAIYEATDGFRDGNVEAQALYENLLNAVSAGLELQGLDLATGIAAAADEAARLEQKLRDAYGLYGFTRERAPDEPVAAPSPGGRRGGGGARANPIEAQLESLRNSLMTQEEAQIASFQRQQETLEVALQQRLLTQQEYNALIEAAQQQHTQAMTAIDAYRYGSGLDKAETFFGDMASAFASGNERMIAIGQKFAAIEALINAGRAFAQVAADPSLPWFAKIPAAIGVASAISQFASSAGIGGAGGIGAATTQAQAAPQMTQVANIVLNGDSFSQQSVKGLFDQLNEGFDNGLRLRVVTG